MTFAARHSRRPSWFRLPPRFRLPPWIRGDQRAQHSGWFTQLLPCEYDEFSGLSRHYATRAVADDR